ncbi:MAG: oxidoreductase, partial [Phycisphaerae bacterium]|nr:oxidoreductase [Phycisphaerae bacterium]
DGEDEKDFLTGFFPTMSKMATNIFLKGYQWLFDPQRIENFQSSLIDVLVFSETQKGRRVFLDFTRNPVGGASMKEFDLKDLEPDAREYLGKNGAMQAPPIERLAHMNPLAIDIYRENGIDISAEPLEIAVCAQHNNGGFAVDNWWQSSLAGTFVIGEMAGTHGVKRPGGSALNAGQVGGLRAAEFIVNACGTEVAAGRFCVENERELKSLEDKLAAFCASSKGRRPREVIREIQSRMTASGGHIRRLKDCEQALAEALALYRDIRKHGLKACNAQDFIAAVQGEHLALASVAFLKAMATLLRQGCGSRGSHLVLTNDGTEIHPDVVDLGCGKALKFKPENEALRESILRTCYDEDAEDLFRCESVPVRAVEKALKAFEVAWRDFREGKIYGE